MGLTSGNSRVFDCIAFSVSTTYIPTLSLLVQLYTCHKHRISTCIPPYSQKVETLSNSSPSPSSPQSSHSQPSSSSSNPAISVFLRPPPQPSTTNSAPRPPLNATVPQLQHARRLRPPASSSPKPSTLFTRFGLCRRRHWRHRRRWIGKLCCCQRTVGF